MDWTKRKRKRLEAFKCLPLYLGHRLAEKGLPGLIFLGDFKDVGSLLNYMYCPGHIGIKL